MVTSQAVSTNGLEEQPGLGICRLYLVRHGTTTLNEQNRYRGRRDIPLDATGYQDALDTAGKLSHARLTAVYTGPLRRTIAAAQIIANEARVPDLRILHGLNNVDYGAWEGMTAQEAATFDPDAFELYRTSPSRAACPGGERLSDAQQRMIDAIQLISSRHAGETVVAVTHAVMIRLLMSWLTGTEDERWRRPVGHGPAAEFHLANGTIRPVDALEAR